MPFGLTREPSTFMWLMNTILKPLIGKSVMVRWNFSLYPFTIGACSTYLTLLDILCRERLYVNLEKCNFYKKDLKYLSFVILGDGLKMDPKKIKSILDAIAAPITECIKQKIF
eukprot:Gb_14585 [translate_table: standard]